MDCPGTKYEVRKDGILYKVYIDAIAPGNIPTANIPTTNMPTTNIPTTNMPTANIPSANNIVASPQVKKSSKKSFMNRFYTRKNVKTNNQALPKVESPSATTIFKNPLSQESPASPASPASQESPASPASPVNMGSNRNRTFKNTPVPIAKLTSREQKRISSNAIQGPQPNTLKTPQLKQPYSPAPTSKSESEPESNTNTSRILPLISKAINTGSLTENQIPANAESTVQTFKNTPISIPTINPVKKSIISASGIGSQRTNTRTTRRAPLKNLIQPSINKNRNTKKLIPNVSSEIQTRNIQLPGTPTRNLTRNQSNSLK